MIVGLALKQLIIQTDFLVMKIPSTYNVFFGRPGLNTLQVIVLTCDLLVRFPTPNGMGEVWEDQVLARKCYMVTLRGEVIIEFGSEELKYRMNSQNGEWNPLKTFFL